MANCAWNELLRTNLELELLDGLAVITHHGILVEKSGRLKAVPDSFWRYFNNLFKFSDPEHDQRICSKGIQLETKEGPVCYKIYLKTHTSIYGVSEDGCFGIIISNLPYGKLIALYDMQLPSNSKAIQSVEKFCDKLRL